MERKREREGEVRGCVQTIQRLLHIVAGEESVLVVFVLIVVLKHGVRMAPTWKINKQKS